jgi:hypothetical protein
MMLLLHLHVWATTHTGRWTIRAAVLSLGGFLGSILSVTP